jgi:hypothetical protein
MLRVGSRESSSVIISIKFLISIGFFDNALNIWHIKDFL